MSERVRDESTASRANNSNTRQSGGSSASGGGNNAGGGSSGNNTGSNSTRGKSDRRGPHTNSSPSHRSKDHQGGNAGGGRMHHHGGGGMGMNSMMGPRVMNIFSGQAFSETDLMSDLPKKKFTGRCRLFVGNLPMDLKEEELKELFTPHGDIAECYLSGKGFAFLRMDTRAHAESAKEAIDGKIIHGRPVRVRFAVHGAALKVKELSSTVSNEMLYHAFSAFGEVERAVHIVDEKGKPTGEGIVEFERKPSANEALHQIREKVFLLTASPKPLIVEMLEPRDEDDGLAERMIQRNAQLQKEREVGPRFPPNNSFEYVFGMKWKELYEMERQRRSQLEEELKEARRRLESDMELAFQDYQTQLLREDLLRRQQELERLEAAKRERMAQVAARRGEMPTSLMGNSMSGGPGGPHPMGIGGINTGPFGGGGPGPDMNRGPPPNQGEMMRGGPQDNMMRGGPPVDGPLGRNMAPPFQPNNPNQHVSRPNAPGNAGSSTGNQPGPGGPDPTLVQGVQKLLQIFKSENPSSGRHMQQPPQGFNSPGFGPGGPFMGGPGHGFRGPPMNDYHPNEKRMRR